jgi:hypothetical protein
LNHNCLIIIQDKTKSVNATSLIKEFKRAQHKLDL